MKNIKFLILIILAAFLFTASEIYAHPRYRVCRVVHRVYPAYYTGHITGYYVVKRPKVIHRHHKKIIRKVIYY